MWHTQQTLLYTKLPPLLVLSTATAAAAAATAEAVPAMNNVKNQRTTKASQNLSNSTKNIASRSMETLSSCEQLNGDANKTRSHYSQRLSSYLRRATTVRGKGKKKNERRTEQRLGCPVLRQNVQRGCTDSCGQRDGCDGAHSGFQNKVPLAIYKASQTTRDKFGPPVVTPKATHPTTEAKNEAPCAA